MLRLIGETTPTDFLKVVRATGPLLSFVLDGAACWNFTPEEEVEANGLLEEKITTVCHTLIFR